MTEQQLARMAKRRLAILRHAEEITGNAALTCRYYGISRQCFYTWRRRGLGAAVTAFLVEDAGWRGAETVFLSAGDDAVARVYERLGFRRVGVHSAAEPPQPASH